MELRQSMASEKQVEISNKRGHMKYFRKADGIEMLELQSIRRQSLVKLCFKDMMDTKNIVQLMRSQRSTLKILKTIQLEKKNQLFLCQVIPMLSQIRKNFCRLRQLKFPGEIAPKGKACLRVMGKNHKQLDQLSLDFEWFLQLTYEGVKRLAIQISKHLINLLELNLNLKCCENIPDEAISVLVERIGNSLKKLVLLNINFSFCFQITDKGIQGLASQFHSLKKLRTLILNLTHCREITDQGIFALSFHIGSDLPHLRQLSLNFSNCRDITDRAVETLAKQIGHNQNLIGLILSFHNCQKITNSSLQALAGLIREKLHYLQHLSLDFYWCIEITDEGVKALSYPIVTLQHLKHLELHFENGDLTDEAFLSLINLNLNQLHSLVFGFSHSGQLTDQVLEALANKLGKNPHQLRRLELLFQNCSSLTEKGVLAFISQLNDNLQQLQDFTLDFLYNTFTDEIKEILKRYQENWSKQINYGEKDSRS